MAPPPATYPIRRTLLVLLPLLFLIALETTLRTTSLGQRPPLFIPLHHEPDRTLLLLDRERPASFFRVGRDRMSPIHPVAVWMPKPPPTLRILWIGESAAKGFPQPPGFAASVFLEAMLQEFAPGSTIEVINLAATALSSDAVLDLLTQGLALDPDAVVIYTGHNEFYGSRGLLNRPRWTSAPGFHRIDRWVQSLAITRLIDRLLPTPEPPDPQQHLMEWMGAGQTLSPHSPLHHRAADSFRQNLHAMIRACAKAGVPLVLCTLPANHRDFLPFGPLPESEPALQQMSLLTQALDRKDSAAALHHARLARDLDPMPWRATTPIQDTIREAAHRFQLPLCDLETIFHLHSPHGITGWELMDDHVHPSLEGQRLIATSVTPHLTSLLLPETPLSTENLNAIDWLERLGDNPYDRFSVAVTLTRLFQLPLFASNATNALPRFSAEALRLASDFSPRVRQAMNAWIQAPETGAGRKPASGLAAAAFLLEQDIPQARNLYRVARRHVPPYSSWKVEFSFYEILCAYHFEGSLSESERDLAETLIAQATLLEHQGHTSPGVMARYIGPTLNLLHRHAEAIPWLLTARDHLEGRERFTVDHALVKAYQETDQSDLALAIIQEGIRREDPWSGSYWQLLADTVPPP